MRFFKIAGVPFVPKSVLCLKDYSRKTFFADLVAGVTVGLVALPLAMAFAISSGVSPQAGLYCAIIAGFVISALGGSRTQIGGPTGAFVVVVAGIIAKYGLDGLFTCTVMAGAMLIVLGVTGLGTAVRFIPRPVVIGFTNGIAVLIASTQIKDFFGLEIEQVPGEFIERMSALADNWNTGSAIAVTTSIAALVVIIVMRHFVPRIPGSIVALIGGTLVTWIFGLQLETIATRFGGIPQGIPHLSMPGFRPELMLHLLAPALTIMMLGAIESLLSAVVADRMSGDKHNPNVELFAQGVANMLTPFVGGLPATGAIARTATNIRSGAKTPVAGMIHALTLLAIILVAAPLAGQIPLCILAAILMVVAYNMGEWQEIPDILKLSKSDISVWAITFGLTVFADLTVAVEAGMILAALVYIRNVTLTTTVARVTPEYVSAGFAHSLQTNEIPAGVAVFRIHGPFLFGATEKLALVEQDLESLPPVVVLRLRNMTAIDATGIHALEHLAERLRKSGRHLLVCGMRDQPASLMTKAEFHRLIGEANIAPTLEAALMRARELLRQDPAVPVSET
ncbi:MAG TPA: SulP family inorganic anion transporter [Planctomycetota bacterium]|nr:SulP family inorganic anion transporter [Planctomycetota bacterium]